MLILPALTALIWLKTANYFEDEKAGCDAMQRWQFHRGSQKRN